ncbi:hypothetical protein D3C85_1229010 [compost metagenome]
MSRQGGSHTEWHQYVDFAFLAHGALAACLVLTCGVELKRPRCPHPEWDIALQAGRALPLMHPVAPAALGFQHGQIGAWREVGLEVVIDGQLEVQGDTVGVQVADTVPQIELPAGADCKRLLRGVHPIWQVQGGWKHQFKADAELGNDNGVTVISRSRG